MIKFVSYPFSSKSYLSALRKYTLLTTGLVTISFPALAVDISDVSSWNTVLGNTGNVEAIITDSLDLSSSGKTINSLDLIIDGNGKIVKGYHTGSNGIGISAGSLSLTNVNFIDSLTDSGAFYMVGNGDSLTLSGSFKDNISSGSDKGGVVTLKEGTTLNINTDGGVETIFQGNTNNGEFVAIYNKDGTVNLNSATNNIIFYDKIAGTGGTINIDGTGENKVLLKNSVTGNTINLKSGTLDVSEGDFGKTGDSVSIVANGGTFNIGTRDVVVNNATFKAGSVLSLAIDAIDTHGSLTASNWTVDGGKLLVALASNVVTNSAQEFQLLNGVDTAETNAFAREISENNNMYTFEATETAGKYIITKTSSGSDVSSNTGGTQNNANTAAAWVDSGNAFPAGSTSAAVAEKLHNLAQLDNKGDYNAALTALAPEVSPVVQAVSMEIIGQVFQAVSSRLSSGNVTAAAEGKSSGDSLFEKVATWVQVLTNKTELDTANGFDMDTNGIAMGIEKRYDANWKIGAGYSYGDSDIEAFLRDIDVSSHTFFTYAEYKPSNWFVNAVASYTFSDMEESKHVAGGVYGAKYDVNALGLQVMTGYDTLYRGVNVTPHAGLRYYRIDRDSYTDGAGQRVKSNTMDVLTAVAGAKVSKDFTTCGGTHWKPEARLAMTYDIISDEDNAVVGLSNGTNYMIQGDRLDRFGVETGVGVVVDVNDQVETRVGYEGKFRDDYTDHSGMLNVMYKF